MSKTLGEKLLFLREQRHYTQDEISAKLYVGRAAYCNYERNARTPSLGILIDIANLYGVKIDFLLRPDFSGYPYLANDDEQDMLDAFRLLDEASRRRLVDHLKFYLKQVGKL